MANIKGQQPDLQQQMNEFEQQNPRITEAMQLFGMSITTYQGALHALYSPRVYLSSSTNPQDKNQHG